MVRAAPASRSAGRAASRASGLPRCGPGSRTRSLGVLAAEQELPREGGRGPLGEKTPTARRCREAPIFPVSRVCVKFLSDDAVARFADLQETYSRTVVAKTSCDPTICV